MNLVNDSKALTVIVLFAVAFVVSAVATGVMIPYLRKHQFGQFIREEGPDAHKSKAGTPTMGGLAIVLGIIASSLLAIFGSAKLGDVIAFLLTMLAYALIGFIDDYNKIAKKENEGLTPKQKIALQVVFGLGLAIYMMKTSGTLVYIPFVKSYVNFKWLYPLFIIFVEIAMANSVNLTDGLDGLASSVTSIVALLFVGVGLKHTRIALSAAMHFGKDDILVTCGIAVAGACLGFLLFNKFPAKIFMGDTGSMALGGALAAMAIIGKMEFLLPIAGLLYVIEALSVIIQVMYFKRTGGKRVFRMAPIHHHFELGGMHEKRVVLLFAAFTAIMCAIAYVGV